MAGFQEVNVNRKIDFGGVAAVSDNIEGNPSNKKHVWEDNFVYLNTSIWTSTLDGTSDAVAATAAGVHGLTLTTGTGNNEVSFLGTPLIYDISNSPEIEIVLDLVDVSGTFVYFGFADANTESTPAATIDASGGTLVNAATDAAGFVIDADLGSSSIYCASVNNQGAGGTVQSVDSGLDWSDGQKKTLRVSLDTSGHARFWVDGVQKGYIASAVADVPLCAIINYGTRDNDGSNTVYARRFKSWSDVAA